MYCNLELILQSYRSTGSPGIFLTEVLQLQMPQVSQIERVPSSKIKI